jgi:hypothetical protein
MWTIFKADKFPYLLAALFGILTWATTHIADRLINSPIIKYKTEEKKVGSHVEVVYHIKNVSKDKAFEKIDFFLEAENPDTIYCLERELFPPIKVNSTIDTYGTSENTANAHIDRFQPNEYFDMKISKKLEKIIDLRISSTSTVILEEENIETFILEYESEILLAIIVISILSITIYAIIFNKVSSTP